MVPLVLSSSNFSKNSAYFDVLSSVGSYLSSNLSSDTSVVLLATGKTSCCT